MAEYEVVREIQNSCEGNQMRDIFFDEIETDDPAAWVREQFPDRELTIDVQTGAHGEITIYAQTPGLNQKFLFTQL